MPARDNNEVTGAAAVPGTCHVCCSKKISCIFVPASLPVRLRTMDNLALTAGSPFQ